MRRSRARSERHPMLRGIAPESATWMEKLDLHVNHDILHQEYSQLYSHAIAVRDDPPEYDLRMARANVVKQQRDTVLQQIVDMPDVTFATGVYSAQTIVPAKRPSIVHRALSWLR